MSDTLNLTLCPKYKRETEGGRTFAVSTIKQWNQLPKTVRDKGTVASFKHSMKQLFKESYENIDHAFYYIIFGF